MLPSSHSRCCACYAFFMHVCLFVVMVVHRRRLWAAFWFRCDIKARTGITLAALPLQWPHLASRTSASLIVSVAWRWYHDR